MEKPSLTHKTSQKLDSKMSLKKTLMRKVIKNYENGWSLTADAIMNVEKQKTDILHTTQRVRTEMRQSS